MSRSTLPPPQIGLPVISALPGFPETTYLDSVRLLVLTTDAADAMTLYMFLLLYRQLVFSDLDGESHTKPKVELDALLKMKREIRDIGGCYNSRDRPPWNGWDTSALKPESNGPTWQSVKRDIILQISMRAKEARSHADCPALIPSERLQSVFPPDERTLKLAQEWSETNMRSGTSLGMMLQTRLRDALFYHVVALTYPRRDLMAGRLPAVDFGSFGMPMSRPGNVDLPFGADASLKPLGEEIHSIGERIAKLALIHLNAYLPLYEQTGFLDS